MALLAGVASGAALSLAFPPADLGWAATISLIPLVWIFRRGSWPALALAALGFGSSFFPLLLDWIRLFGVEAYVGLSLTETLLVMAVLLVGRLALRDGRPAAASVVFAAAWTAGEYLRSMFPFGGFNWGGLAYSQHDSQVLLPLAAFTGAWGLTFVVALMNALLYEAVTRARRSTTEAAPWAIAAVLLLLVPGFLPQGHADGPAVRVAIIQGNAPEDLDDPGADDVEVLRNHVRLTRQLPEGADLVLWPESSLDTDPINNPTFGEAVAQTVRATGAHFLVGSAVDMPGRRFRNTTLFYEPEGRLLDSYDKRHLVPFGEYIPYRGAVESLFGWVEELQRVPFDGIPGREATVFDIGEGKVASVICYESTFPSLVRSFVTEGARLLTVSTNNSSFERTAASAQHVAFSQLRAAEHHTWVLHAALTGISAVVSPEGRVVDRTELFEPAVLLMEVRFTGGLTFYGRWGDWLPLTSLALVLLLLPGGVRSRAARRRPLVGIAGRGLEPGSPTPRVLVAIPTYEEAENIEKVIEAVRTRAPEAEILVIDDASGDGTADLVRTRVASDDKVHLIERESKLGLGTAYVRAFHWGLDQGFDRFIEMDADLSHDPGDIPRLVAASESSGLAIGTRYIPGGGVEGWAPYRRLLSRASNFYARALLGLPARDSTSGFRCYRREVLEAISLDEVHSEGYAFQIDMTYRAWRWGFGLSEVPIIFRERSRGRSKISRSIIWEAAWRVALWGLSDLFLGTAPPPNAVRSTESREPDPPKGK